MITIFVKTGCPYCERVLAALTVYNVAFEEKNIANEAVARELVEKGGKVQVPYIIDGDVSLYESDEIVAYIEKKYGMSTDNSPSKPRVHIARGTGVCPS
jgi:glutaredoxin 3